MVVGSGAFVSLLKSKSHESWSDGKESWSDGKEVRVLGHTWSDTHETKGPEYVRVRTETNVNGVCFSGRGCQVTENKTGQIFEL